MGIGHSCCFFLCGDTAHFHKKVLSEVVFGEFHPAIRTPFGFREFYYFSFCLKAEAENPQVGGCCCCWVSGEKRNGCVSKKFWTPLTSNIRRKKNSLEVIDLVEELQEGKGGILPR